MKSIFDNARWIWRKPAEDDEHQYVCFRKEFSADDISRGKLYISADTDFVAYLNGQEIGRGQFSDYPEEKTYSEFQIESLLTPGMNVLCVLAYYCGADFSTYRKGRAGIIAVLKNRAFEIVSDGSWKCIQAQAFQSGGLPRLTAQLGFVTMFDARNDSDWTNPDFDDSPWPAAEVRAGIIDGFWNKLSLRPVPPLTIGKRIPVQVVMQGVILRKLELETFADTVAHDMMGHYPVSRIFEGIESEYISHLTLDGAEHALTFKPPEAPANGSFVVADLGSENTGFIDIELTAAAGTVIDISHGEHLLDGKVRNKIGPRNFTDRYICKDGLNHYVLPFRRIGGRYIQLNITCMKSPVSISYIGLRPLSLPLPPRGYFQSGDTLADRNYDIGVRTLELCMHEHYEDCPWREQALYTYDSRNQMLYGYYVWGNYDFAAVSLDLLGRGIRSDGLLELCAPAKVPITIPIFSFVWVAALKEYWLHSGSDTLFHKFDAQIEFMIGKIQELYNPKNGLYRLKADKEMWHFYEWIPGLSGMGTSDNEYHAPYHLYFYEMLCSYAKMLQWSGQNSKAVKYLDMAAELQCVINRSFWDSLHNCYATKLINGNLQERHEHIQVLAVYNKIVPEEKLPLLLQSIYSEKLAPMTFSAMPYMLRSMMLQTSEARKYVAAKLAGSFYPIVLSGATSLWETPTGAADFDGAGSLCHAWSSLPVYYYHAWVLGVRPLEPGFKKFLLSPCSGGFNAVKGSVATPSGFINVKWRESQNGLQLTATGPENLTPELALLEEAPIISATYNGIAVKY
ncbi:MAG: family 78 glycoside hydrolase catalytic domain [Lentisphaerota bacterium]